MIKTIRLKQCVLLVAIFSSQLVISQENYLPGYVINNEKDTLYGFVDYRNWSVNPSQIMFKLEINDKPALLKPVDIIEFKVDKEIYVSGIINAEVSSLQTDKLNENPQLEISVDTIFLQTLFEGPKSLYYYKSDSGRENFYVRKNDTFDLLVYKKYLKQQDSKSLIIENKKYIGQLILYFNEGENMNTKIKNTLYNQNSLISLFQYYYKSSLSEIRFQKNIEKIKIDFGLMGGLTLTSCEFNSLAFPYLVKADYNTSFNFSPGISVNLILPRNQGKWSINNEILFSKYKIHGSYTDFSDANNYSITTAEIGYSYLKLNNMIRFKYPIGVLSVFVNAGASNGIAIDETNYKKTESKFYSGSAETEELAIKDTRKYEQSIIFGAGLGYDRFSFEIRYENGNGMSEYSSLRSTTNRFYMLFRYRILK